MKRITAIALFAIANFALAGASFAQTDSVKANIPFDFTVSNHVLPAGTYTIKKDSEQTVQIRNHDKPVAALAVVRQDNKTSSNGGKLVFHKYGDQYFLSEILCDSANMNLALPTSKTEKTVRLQEASIHTAGETLVATSR